MTLFEFIYYAGYSLKKRLVLKDRKRLPHPVISIGNITVGGTGKTPAAIAVAEEARKRGWRPVILTRGYRGSAKGHCLVSDGEQVLLSAREAGDEPVIMAERLKGAPVVKSASRYEGGLFAIRNLPDCKDPLLFILDDGFQHWALRRDIDVVLVDGINPFGNRKLLPAGPLRGPLSELKAADILVVTKTRNELLAGELREINNNAPIFFSDYKVTGLRSIDGSLTAITRLSGRKVYAFCGIANPDSFRKTLQQSGCRIVEMKSYRDHHNYSQKDMAAILDRSRQLGAEIVITTEKDMVKIRQLKEAPQDLLSLEISFSADAAFFDTVFALLDEGPGK